MPYKISAHHQMSTGIVTSCYFRRDVSSSGCIVTVNSEIRWYEYATRDNIMFLVGGVFWSFIAQWYLVLQASKISLKAFTPPPPPPPPPTPPPPPPPPHPPPHTPPPPPPPHTPPPHPHPHTPPPHPHPLVPHISVSESGQRWFR